MCGISGILCGGSVPHMNLKDAATTMAASLKHRGPDDFGVWVDEAAGIALGHCRLAILDLSAAGHQPMVSASGRFVIAYNGEIYNHLELRKDLGIASTFSSPPRDEGISVSGLPASQSAGNRCCWRGHSDTETMLASIEAWGVEKALQKFVGMFAFALWDRQERCLTLARDRLGEKPLYYGWSRGALVCGSELKAICAYPWFDNPVERKALTLYMRHNYIPCPWSIYQNIWKLPPGCYVTFKAEQIGKMISARGDIKSYWSLRDIAEAGLAQPFSGSAEEALSELECLLRNCVSGQMLADVPLGALLSGGIDSSTVVALMQAQSSRPVRTFSIGFCEKEYNEAEYARDVARHLGTEHTELYVTPAEALQVIPRLPEIYDEPFADSSQVPTSLVMHLARQGVTVALSGDGGDEVFGGYNRYHWASFYWRYCGRLPVTWQRAAARIITSASPSAWNRLWGLLAPLLPKWMRYTNPGDKLHKFAGLLGAPNPEQLYHLLHTHWVDPTRLVRGGEEPSTAITDMSAWLSSANFEQRMMYLDTLTYLPDDILVKVDRAAMSVSLETRAPYLDHRVIEFAWRLPLAFKIRGGKGKWLLRQLLYKYVPRSLVERAKMGFGLPIDRWLRGPLRDWAEALLSEERLRRDGFFEPAPIREKWAEHLSGRRNWQHLLWDVLMFEAWLENRSAKR